MSDLERIEAILRALPRGPGCTDQVITNMAAKIVLVDHLVGKFEPLPPQHRDAVKAIERNPTLIPKEDRDVVLDGIEALKPRVHLKGKPKKERAKIVTQLCDQAFRSITGKPAPRGQPGGYAAGPLVDLVSDVFKALNIEASAQGQVKSLWKNKEFSS